MRQAIVAGNWKMNGTAAEARRLADAVREHATRMTGVEVVLCPPFTALAAVGDRIDGTPIRLGAQDLHWEAAGAYTGEVSAAMLRELSCAYVIVGHSERRTLFGETDREVNLKARAALAAGLRPIVCIGETLEQREAGQTEDVLTRQLRAGLAGIESGWSEIVVAYEPVWAIGTGKNASAAQAQTAHAHIRATLSALAGGAAAAQVRIQYGGSVKPANAAELFAGADVDGGLIGGASLDAESFAQIVGAVLAH